MKGPRETDFAYQAVYRYLTSLISEHATDARVRLPSLRQLAQRLNVSISTIQYAYTLRAVNDCVKIICSMKWPYCKACRWSPLLAGRIYAENVKMAPKYTRLFTLLKIGSRHPEIWVFKALSMTVV